jgi:hypothetical protein
VVVQQSSVVLRRQQLPIIKIIMKSGKTLISKICKEPYKKKKQKKPYKEEEECNNTTRESKHLTFYYPTYIEARQETMGAVQSRGREPRPRRGSSSPTPSSDGGNSRQQQELKNERVRAPAAKRMPWNPAKAAQIYDFTKASDGSRASWRMGSQTPEAFAAQINDSGAKFITQPTLTVYFQVSATHCARRQFRNSKGSGFTLAKILALIHSTAVSAAVMSIKEQLGKDAQVMQGQIHSYLSSRSVSTLYVGKSQIYVKVTRTSQSMRGGMDVPDEQPV